MSYTGTMVYYPATTTFDAIRDTLARRFESAKLKASLEDITLAFGESKVIRIVRDVASHVPEEARWHGERAEPGPRAALDRAAYRVQIAPADPAADPDDMYNELLFTFEVLRDMTDAVGIDPFDGAVYFNAPAKVATKQVATKKAATNKKAAAKKKATKKAVTKNAKPKAKAKKRASKR
jgi:hypothetical protein